jgi:hypothetical protein
VFVDISKHRLQNLIAARLSDEIAKPEGGQPISAATAVYADERAARRAFGAVLIRVLIEQFDDDDTFANAIARHPNANAAFDRLAAELDVGKDGAQRAGVAERARAEAREHDAERERAEFDMSCDNDPDGLS